MTVMTSFIHSALWPALQLTVCIAVCQYITIHWVQYSSTDWKHSPWSN